MTTRKRYSVLAALMSIVAPGLGFLYAGRMAAAIATPLLLFGAVAVLGWSRIILQPNNILALVMVMAGAYVLVAVSSAVVCRRHREEPARRFQRWQFYVLFFAAFWALNVSVRYLRADVFGFEPFRFPSSSMSGTLLPNDFILVDTWRYRGGTPERGDIVVFRLPRAPSILYAKRLIGFGGEKVLIRDGVVHINGTELKEPYVQPENNRRSAEETIRINIPEGHYFVLGDNRDHSNDSRYWGFVTPEHLHGKALYIWWSWGEGGAAREQRLGKRL